MANEVWTVLKLLGWMKEHFSARKVDSPRLAAEVLLAHVLGCPRIELYARHDKEPTEQQRATLRELVKRAADHVPVAYLVGRKEFYSLSFKVTPDVLIPRPETEGVVAEALAILERLDRPGRVWDVCTGSGCVAVAIANQALEVTVLATDVSEGALAVAAENAQALDAGDRVLVARAD
ncbi:MAG: peptide chain release factor N(5)-glutamine methyltransferase, partial [Planctomycetota bacterium]|nr:peptide chain release factor N(5)-glutamine methyltransferase [Planctomycetota bacterium]